MTTRPEWLKALALGTGDSLVTVTNHVRSVTSPEVPAPYNTTLGRGHRHIHQKAEWACSTFLAMMLNDPKNAAWRVPACGNLRTCSPFLVKSRIHPADLSPLASLTSVEETTVEFSVPMEPWLGDTLFEVLVKLVSTVAIDWNGPTHRDLRNGFSLTIGLSGPIWANMVLFRNRDENYAVSSFHVGFEVPDSKIEISAVTPIQRQAVIHVQHIEMLALLYANTLRHEGALPPSTASQTAPASTTAGTETGNAGSLPQEPAPSDCQLSALATSDDDTHIRANGVDNRGSKTGVCVSSSGKRVRAGAATTNRRRQHAFTSHHHALA